MSDALTYEIEMLRFEESFVEQEYTIDQRINDRARVLKRFEREEVPMEERPFLITMA
jgi:hypothetical protein